MPIPVIVDTNFLTVPAQFGVDVFSEAERVLERGLEFILLDSVVEEIRSKLESASRTEARMFRVALDLAGRCTIVRVDKMAKTNPVDDQLLDYTKSVEGVLATNDRELRERAKSLGIPVLLLRGKKHLELEGSLI
ncbi:MAG: type II toxin-antitoxin system VapC family toxin [Candidatus Thorarchaeota archaeon]|jgi:rRNA-processing protein FCF1